MKDPVCGMTVDTDAAGDLQFERETSNPNVQCLYSLVSGRLHTTVTDKPVT